MGQIKEPFKHEYPFYMSKYRTRKGYEDLLIQLSEQTRSSLSPNLGKMSDYQLLYMVNLQLIKLDLMPLNEEELEMELTTSIKIWR